MNGTAQPPPPLDPAAKITRDGWIAAAVGTFLLLLVLGISLLERCPSPTTWRIMLVVLALAAAAFATMITGLIVVSIGATDGTFLVRAGGAIAVFVIVFRFDPAGFEEGTRCSSPLKVTNVVLLNEDHVKFEGQSLSLTSLGLKSSSEFSQKGSQALVIPIGFVIRGVSTQNDQTNLRVLVTVVGKAQPLSVALKPVNSLSDWRSYSTVTAIGVDKVLSFFKLAPDTKDIPFVVTLGCFKESDVPTGPIRIVVEAKDMIQMRFHEVEIPATIESTFARKSCL